jgi:predicted metal-binding protein
MLDYDKLFKLAEECGFNSYGKLDVSTLEFLPEVRDMCAVNSCGMYNKSWACPPACGTLDEMRERVKKFKSGIIVQTVGQLEDSLDWEGIQEAAEKQAVSYQKMMDALKKEYPGLLPMGTGTCTNCKKCTYPDEPCRFPEKLVSSMEACGLVVSNVCTANGVPYNHGKDTICYTGCFLLE